ncbi:hypothetical protein Acsp05_41940 [Actinokineospora sp. NBRC 105648]|nr:hypothetical protein Acsp05_41940 [Actinokineospora sp. NBRC 105648]
MTARVPAEGVGVPEAGTDALTPECSDPRVPTELTAGRRMSCSRVRSNLTIASANTLRTFDIWGRSATGCC